MNQLSPKGNYLALISLSNLVDKCSTSFFALDVCTGKMYIPVESRCRTIPYEAGPLGTGREGRTT